MVHCFFFQFHWNLPWQFLLSFRNFIVLFWVDGSTSFFLKSTIIRSIKPWPFGRVGSGVKQTNPDRSGALVQEPDNCLIYPGLSVASVQGSHKIPGLLVALVQESYNNFNYLNSRICAYVMVPSCTVYCFGPYVHAVNQYHNWLDIHFIFVLNVVCTTVHFNTETIQLPSHGRWVYVLCFSVLWLYDSYQSKPLNVGNVSILALCIFS